MKDFSKINIFILFLLFISIQSIDPKAKEVNNLSIGNNTQKKTGKKTIPINTYNQPKNRTTTNNKNNKNNINNNRYRRIYDIINQYKRSRQIIIMDIIIIAKIIINMIIIEDIEITAKEVFLEQYYFQFGFPY